MLNQRTLARINAQPKQVNRPLLMLIGAGSLVPAAVVFVLTSSLPIALAALLVGVLGVLVAYRAQKAKMITTLTYDNLQEELKERFSAVQEGCEALSSSEAIWRLGGPLERRARKGSDATLPPKRQPAQVGVLETPGIRTDVPTWGIEAGDEKVLFFPEAVLLYRGSKGAYEGYSYEQLAVGIYSTPFYERAGTPGR